MAISSAVTLPNRAVIEDDMRISDMCISETVAYFSPTSENDYQCIERKKYDQSLLDAGYLPYVPYGPGPHHDGYDHAKIVVNVHVDEAGSHPQY